MERVFAGLARHVLVGQRLESPSAPVGQVWTHWPQKVQAESLSNPPNSVVIWVSKPRFMQSLMA